MTEGIVIGAIVLIALYLLYRLITPTQGPGAKVINLTEKIAEKKGKLTEAERKAQESLEEYRRAKKALDDFNNDDPDDKPSA